MSAQEKDTAKDQAAAQLESIREMVFNLRAADDDARENTNDGAREGAEQRIHEDALSVEVRKDWHTVGSEDVETGEYRILLCTGGPAVQIVGDLSKHKEPETAHLQYQDWGTPWTNYGITSEDEEVLLDYARCFYFDE